jgi:hypothetical protein
VSKSDDGKDHAGGRDDGVLKPSRLRTDKIKHFGTSGNNEDARQRDANAYTHGRLDVGVDKPKGLRSPPILEAERLRQTQPKTEESR